MINKILTKVFGSQHERDIKKMDPLADQIEQLEPQMEALSDDALRSKTDEFRQRLADGASLDDLLVEAFAVVREAARRSIGMRHYRVQLIGGIVLHRGDIAEMKTGEGKTLVATLPAYLNALGGDSVHLVTVNDYLARRDAEWMGKVYRFLGLTVAALQNDMDDAARKKAYEADILYGTNNEFGFDYLRDNMKFDLESMVQRGHHYAIVDEVDSILIDEARTPLIISGPSEQSVDKYYSINAIIPKLQRGEEIEHEDGRTTTTGHFVVDEKAKSVALTDEGVAKVEELLNLENLYDPENMDTLHGVNQGLRAHHLFQKDVHYIVQKQKKAKEVIIVDEFTGRMMPGRRWSDGLHQAVEAKEGVKSRQENQTLATITLQNYFRLYDKLAGMTGTADTEADEFHQIYDLGVTVIPTNEPVIRKDHDDQIYRTAEEKWEAVADEIERCHKQGQPVLVGTVSIENSELVSKKLADRNVRHNVLNAKFHAKEADIVAQAGRKGQVTIATNMAGRGTDIVLGGNPEGQAESEANPETEPDKYRAVLKGYKDKWKEEREEVLKAGGLHILGTERHESRRIDNQLRGRAGRQGDPGSSRFFLSLEDDLMRIFIGNDKLKNMMSSSMQEGQPLELGLVSKAIERAQTQVEARNFEQRKNLLEYDDVMNKQREEVYRLRRDILEGREGRDYVRQMYTDVVEYLVDTYCPAKADPRDWQTDPLASELRDRLNLDLHKLGLDLKTLGAEELQEALLEAVTERYDRQVADHDAVQDGLMARVEQHVMMSTLDRAWKDHLLALDHLKEGIGLRGYGQKDPKQEYKRESFELFEEMRQGIEDSILKNLFHRDPPSEEQIEEILRHRRRLAGRMRLSAPDGTAGRGVAAAGAAGLAGGAGPGGMAAAGARRPIRNFQTPETFERKGRKIGRNEPCPCGSGRKYKKCCLHKEKAAS